MNLQLAEIYIAIRVFSRMGNRFLAGNSTDLIRVIGNNEVRVNNENGLDHLRNELDLSVNHRDVLAFVNHLTAID